jgi:hypothetical protein
VRKLSTDLPFTCVTCEAEIHGRAVFYVGLPFCCAGCVAGGRCTCSSDTETFERTRTPVRHCLDVADPVPAFVLGGRDVVSASRR